MITPVIRPIESRDNDAVRDLITRVLTEYGCTGPGFASNDAELQDMYGYYQQEKCAYWVIVDQDTQKILGGGGFSRLKGTDPGDRICELQKIYFYPELRGLGLGKQIISMAVDAATRAGYGVMYLETHPALTEAIRLYERLGFRRIPMHKGATGHHEKSNIYMILPLPCQDLALTSGALKSA